MIYFSKNVNNRLDEYAAFLRHNASYTIEEAEVRRWEVEFQISRNCNSILMKAGSSGTLKFKSVLQRQEIERFLNNRSQLKSIIKRRNGKVGNTQWSVNYAVSNQGNVYITSINYHNIFSESQEERLQDIINECVDKSLKEWLRSGILNENDEARCPQTKCIIRLSEGDICNIVRVIVKNVVTRYMQAEKS